jgi:hypothetical protein
MKLLPGAAKTAYTLDTLLQRLFKRKYSCLYAIKLPVPIPDIRILESLLKVANLSQIIPSLDSLVIKVTLDTINTTGHDL